MTDVPHIISLGAGVQSSTMALMAAHGEIEPMPVAAVFADTQAEPPSVYRWLDWLETKLPFPVIRARRRNVDPVAQVVQWGFSQIPAFSEGSKGKRQCTKHWKIIPTQRAIRELMGARGKALPDGYVVPWMGSSTDEFRRMKPSREKWITHRWPLVEKRMKRASCLEWMNSHGFPRPPRSACVFCPLKSDREWEETQACPESMQLVNSVQAILDTRGETLHKRGRIGEVDLRTDEEHGQLSLWQEECEGGCGM